MDALVLLLKNLAEQLPADTADAALWNDLRAELEHHLVNAQRYMEMQYIVANVRGRLQPHLSEGQIENAVAHMMLRCLAPPHDGTTGASDTIVLLNKRVTCKCLIPQDPPGIEGLSSPGAALRPSAGKCFRLKTPFGLSAAQCSRMICAPRLEGSSSPTGPFDEPASAPLPAPCPAGKHGSSLCVPRSWLLHQSARAQPGPQQPRVGGTIVHPNLHNHSPQPSQVGSVRTSATWPGIEGHSSPSASLSFCASPGYRLKLPMWMCIMPCCQLHWEPRLEGSSSPTGRFAAPTSARKWPPAPCTVCLQHLHLRSGNVWHAAWTWACALRAEVAAMDQKRCTCRNRCCFCLRGLKGPTCCAKQPLLAVCAAFDTESYVPVVCIPTAPRRRDRGTCCRQHAMIRCLSIVLAHSECTCRSRMIHVLCITVAGALVNRPPWSLICMPQPSFRCQQALCGERACFPKVPLTPPRRVVTAAHTRSARWLEGSTSPDQRADLTTSMATRSVSRTCQDHAAGDSTNRLREVEASASDWITGGGPTNLEGQPDDWLHYHRLEGSASPCCTLPADWSTRPGPQGQPGQLGPGVRMSRPAPCTLHCMLVDCGRLHRISIGRQGSRAPPPDTKGHCLGAGGFIHSTSDQPPGSLSQDPQFSKKAAPSNTFFRPVLCAMGKSAATRARQGRRLGKAQRDALRSQPQPDADPRATVADEPVGLPLTECTITVECEPLEPSQQQVLEQASWASGDAPSCSSTTALPRLAEPLPTAAASSSQTAPDALQPTAPDTADDEVLELPAASRARSTGSSTSPEMIPATGPDQHRPSRPSRSKRSRMPPLPTCQGPDESRLDYLRRCLREALDHTKRATKKWSECVVAAFAALAALSLGLIGLHPTQRNSSQLYHRHTNRAEPGPKSWRRGLACHWLSLHLLMSSPVLGSCIPVKPRVSPVAAAGEEAPMYTADPFLQTGAKHSGEGQILLNHKENCPEECPEKCQRHGCGTVSRTDTSHGAGSSAGAGRSTTTCEGTPPPRGAKASSQPTAQSPELQLWRPHLCLLYRITRLVEAAPTGHCVFAGDTLVSRPHIHNG